MNFFNSAEDWPLIASLFFLETCPKSPNGPAQTGPAKNCNPRLAFWASPGKENLVASLPVEVLSQSVF
jgi:hypothetical protein